MPYFCWILNNFHWVVKKMKRKMFLNHTCIIMNECHEHHNKHHCGWTVTTTTTFLCNRGLYFFSCNITFTPLLAPFMSKHATSLGKLFMKRGYGIVWSIDMLLNEIRTGTKKIICPYEREIDRKKWRETALKNNDDSFSSIFMHFKWFEYLLCIFFLTK